MEQESLNTYYREHISLEEEAALNDVLNPPPEYVFYLGLRRAIRKDLTEVKQEARYINTRRHKWENRAEDLTNAVAAIAKERNKSFNDRVKEENARVHTAADHRLLRVRKKLTNIWRD